MTENKKIYSKDENGKEKEYDVILTFQNEDNKKNYIIYTDNQYDYKNKLMIYAAIYDPYNNNKFIGVPNTVEEWNTIMSLLKQVINNG